MANGAGINVILAVREHIDGEISEARAEIAASETKLAEQREHLYALLAIRHAAGAPATTAASAAPTREVTRLLNRSTLPRGVRP